MGQNEATNLPSSFPKKTTLMPYFQVSLLNPHSSGNDINCICFLPRISSSGLGEESQGFHLWQGALPGSWGSLDPRGLQGGTFCGGGGVTPRSGSPAEGAFGRPLPPGPFSPSPSGNSNWKEARGSALLEGSVAEGQRKGKKELSLV